jgi:hypothetical protein
MDSFQPACDEMNLTMRCVLFVLEYPVRNAEQQCISSSEPERSCTNYAWQPLASPVILERSEGSSPPKSGDAGRKDPSLRSRMTRNADLVTCSSEAPAMGTGEASSARGGAQPTVQIQPTSRAPYSKWVGSYLKNSVSKIALYSFDLTVWSAVRRCGLISSSFGQPGGGGAPGRIG